MSPRSDTATDRDGVEIPESSVGDGRVPAPAETPTATRVRASSIILRDSHERVLIVKRDQAEGIPLPGHWSLVGGRVEEGESFEHAVVRECLEETGLRIREARQFLNFETVNHVEQVFWSPDVIAEDDIVLGEGERFAFVSRRELDRYTFGFSADLIIRLFLHSGLHASSPPDASRDGVERSIEPDRGGSS